jgi:hypothetical protein
MVVMAIRYWFFVAIAWLFICTVTGYDVWFALEHAETFSEWECNGLAVWMGLSQAVNYRVLSVFCGMVAVLCSRSAMRLIGTTVLTVIHAGLLLMYFL